jgi:hypothetical protein
VRRRRYPNDSDLIGGIVDLADQVALARAGGLVRR